MRIARKISPLVGRAGDAMREFDRVVMYSAMHLCLLLGLCVALLSVPATATATDIDHLKATKYEFSVTVRRVGPDGKITSKNLTRTVYRAPDGRVRIEHNDGTSRQYRIQIEVPDQHVVYILNLAKKTFYARPGARLVPGGIYSGKTKNLDIPKKLAPKTIQGLSCQATAWGARDGTYMETWKCVDPISKSPVEADMISRQPDGSGFQQSLQRITWDVEVPRTSFEIPRDFSFFDPAEQDTP